MNHRPTLTEWRKELAQPLFRAFGKPVEDGRITLLCGSKPVADDTTKLLVSAPDGRPLGVCLCSPPAAPDMVARAMKGAGEAKRLLGPTLGRPILDTLIEDRAFGLSYAALPYCRPLSRSWLLGRVQRTLLRPSLFGWLRRATLATASPEAIERGDPEIASALEHLTQFSEMGDSVRDVAWRALDRLAEGTWTPRRVLMHGDLWVGNFLIRPAELLDESRDRFAIIDWAGSRTDGFAFYDLIHLAMSVRLAEKKLANEVAAHCSILGCAPVHALSYLAAALGHIGQNLGYFHRTRYVALVRSSVETLLKLEICSEPRPSHSARDHGDRETWSSSPDSSSDLLVSQLSQASPYFEEPDYLV